MSLVTERGEIDDDYVFVARLDCVKPLLMVLKAIHFKEVGILSQLPKAKRKIQLTIFL